MARHRRTRVLIRGPGLAGPLDRLADVAPSEARPVDAPVKDRPAASTVPERQGLEERLARWFEERERFDRHHQETEERAGAPSTTHAATLTPTVTKKPPEPP